LITDFESRRDPSTCSTLRKCHGDEQQTTNTLRQGSMTTTTTHINVLVTKPENLMREGKAVAEHQVSHPNLTPPIITTTTVMQ
jgi:hypothetical protein